LQLYPLKNAVLDGAARGGFVRKMKLGICILPIPKGRTGFQGPHPEVRVRGSIAHTATLDQVKTWAKSQPGKGALIFKAQEGPVAS